MLKQNQKYVLICIATLAIVMLTLSILFFEQQKNNTRSEKILRQQIYNLQEQNKQLTNTKSKYLNLSGCINTSSAGIGNIDALKEAIFEYKNISQEIINNFFQNQELKELIAGKRMTQLCQSDKNEIAFVIYGGSDDYQYNNIIGIYDGKLIFDKKQNNGGGDEGICTIDGYIESNILYSCGGGDGPWGHNRIYVLNKETGESKIIKDCSFDYQSDIKCDVNLLNLEKMPL